MRCFCVAVIIAAIVGAQVTVASGLRCYVCVPRAGGTVADVQDVFPGVPLLKCEDFDAEDGRFIKDCPADYRGCLTQTNGSHVKRTCGDLSVNDCKIANNIQYCYCSGALCNAAAAPAVPHHPQPPLTSDDEDLLLAHEGSGGGGGEGGAATPPSHRSGGGVATPKRTTAKTSSPMMTTVAPPPPPTVVRSGAATPRTDAVSVVVLLLCAMLAVLGRRRWQQHQ